MSTVSTLLAVVAAACNAFSSVLQRRANRAERQPFGRRMLVDLLRRGSWLGGFGALIASFLLQATALRFGALAAVEPILAAELPMTLLLAFWLLRAPVGRRDAAIAVAMAAGLALLLIGIGPSAHSVPPRQSSVVLAAAVTAAAIVALVLLGRFGPGRFSAAFYGAAAGAGFGLAASMMKISLEGIGLGDFGRLFTRWELYGMMVAGVAALVLVQAALHTGTLVAVQPGLTLFDPVVSVAWGVLVLGEGTNHGPVLTLAGVGAVTVVLSVILLSRSPALDGAR